MIPENLTWSPWFLQPMDILAMIVVESSDCLSGGVRSHSSFNRLLLHAFLSLKVSGCHSAVNRRTWHPKVAVLNLPRSSCSCHTFSLYPGAPKSTPPTWRDHFELRRNTLLALFKKNSKYTTQFRGLCYIQYWGCVRNTLLLAPLSLTSEIAHFPCFSIPTVLPIY